MGQVGMGVVLRSCQACAWPAPSAVHLCPFISAVLPQPRKPEPPRLPLFCSHPLLGASPVGRSGVGFGGREGCAPRDPQGNVVDRSRCGDTGMLAPPAAPVHPWHRPQVEAAAAATCPTPIHLSPQNPTVPASLLVPRFHCMLQRQVHSWGLPANSHWSSELTEKTCSFLLGPLVVRVM